MSRFLIPFGAAFAALFFCLPAMAQALQSRGLSTTAVTVGGTPVTVANGHQRSFFAIFNQSNTATVYCVGDGSTPVASATANQITIPPLSGLMFQSGVIPSNSFSCIASGAGTPLTVIE
jgi:hypothetical protein